jgi:CheY-like chemotaxis protein
LSTLDSSGILQTLEQRVRKIKRNRLPCPFLGADQTCTKPHIRCGERSQYSMRESLRQSSQSHTCNYAPQQRGEYVLMVDDNEQMLRFLSSSFALFLHYSPDKILTATSVSEALSVLSQAKMGSQSIGLVLIDVIMPGRTGYDLVNELYERNHDVEIVLMHSASEPLVPPADYHGDNEVSPGQKVVSAVLLKPFHSGELTQTIASLQFGRGL